MLKDISPCAVGVQFYNCYGSFKCCTTDLHNGGDHCPGGQNQATWNATYSGSGRWYPGSNSTTCDKPVLLPNTCCKNDTSECGSGCPQQNLTWSLILEIEADYPSADDQPPLPSFSSSTSNPASINTLYVPEGAAQQASTTQESPVSSSMPTGTSTTIFESQSALHTATSTPETNTAAIAGGVVGGAVGLALLVGLLAICCRRRTSNARHLDEVRSPAWGMGQNRSIHPNDAELDEMKQGASPTSPAIRPPSPPPPSPLSSSLPPPPVYTPYKSHSNELERSPDHLQPSAGASSPYMSYSLPSPESPPSPPPPKSRLSQQSTSNYSDGEGVSPISSHYQHHPFDDPRGLEPTPNSGISSRELLNTHSMRS